MSVSGQVAPGFEAVRDMFTQNVADAGDGGFAYAAYHEGNKVVDLRTESWSEDTLVPWMSTTKAMTALCVQILSDRGKLDVDEPISSYWPAFGSAGKEAITAADVLTHRSGVMGSDEITAMISLEDGTGLDRTDEILTAFERAEPMWEPGTKTGYHTLSFGWLLDGVIRNVDGRDLGKFFREEVALPLGVPEVWIGTPASEHGRIADVHHMMWPDAMPEPVKGYMETVLRTARASSTPAGVSCLARGGVSVLDRIPEVFNTAPGRTPPLGGSNMVGTARDVAKIFSALAEPENELVSPESVEKHTAIRNSDDDIVLGIPIARALGYWRNEQMGVRPQAYGPNEAAYGHTGAGGQIGFADPVAHVGVAYVRSHHTAFALVPLLLNGALYGCINA